MYLDNTYNLMAGTQLPYPNRPTGPAGQMILGGAVNAGQLPYPNYDAGDIMAPMNPLFTLSAAPNFTVTSPIIPASMLTAVYTPGESYAQAMYNLGSTPGAAYLATSNVTVPGGMMQGTGDVRNVLEPILLADLLLGL